MGLATMAAKRRALRLARRTGADVGMWVSALHAAEEECARLLGRKGVRGSERRRWSARLRLIRKLRTDLGSSARDMEEAAGHLEGAADAVVPGCMDELQDVLDRLAVLSRRAADGLGRAAGEG